MGFKDQEQNELGTIGPRYGGNSDQKIAQYEGQLPREQPPMPQIPVGLSTWEALILAAGTALLTQFLKPMLTLLHEQFSKDAKDADRFKEYLEEEVKVSRLEREKFLEALNKISDQVRGDMDQRSLERQAMSKFLEDHEKVLEGFHKSLNHIVTRLEVLITYVSGSVSSGQDPLNPNEDPSSNGTVHPDPANRAKYAPVPPKPHPGRERGLR